MENGPVEIVDLPIKDGGSFHSYVSLPKGKSYLHHMPVFGQHEHTSPLIPTTATAGESDCHMCHGPNNGGFNQPKGWFNII